MHKINWNEVYRKQSGVLIAVAYRYIRERKQAEDLVQDAFIRAIEKAENFSGKGAFDAWLRKIVVNECLMFLRKSKLQTEDLKENLHGFSDELHVADEEEFVEYSDDPDKRKVIERCNFSREDLLEMATHLPEHHRLTFNMYVIDGFSHKEISTQLNISEGTSKSHLNRARKKMQNLLYEKARDMEKKKKKRLLVAVWFATLFGKTSIVDAMHLKAFADFEMLAPPPSAGLEQAILSAPTTAVGLSTTAVAIIAGCVGVAGGIGGTLGVSELQNLRANSEQTYVEYYAETYETVDFIEPFEHIEHFTPQPQQPTVAPIATPVFDPIIEEQGDIEKDTIEEKSAVIIRRTVKIIDTIFIDPIYEN